MTVLLDAYVLIALDVGEHVHHDTVERWSAAGSNGATLATMDAGLAGAHPDVARLVPSR